MENKKTLHNNVIITNKENSEIEISGEITVEATELYRQKAIKNLSKDLTIPGFRKGHIPENILVKKIGEQVVLGEIAEMALGDVYPKIVLENNLRVIGRPKITITKLAPGNPIGFKIQTAVMPLINLPEYKKIAKEILDETKKEKIEITDKEIDDVILQLRKNKWNIDHDKEIRGTSLSSTKKEPEEKELPELTDTLVKTLGEFTDVNDFKTKLKENMFKEKEMRSKSKRRAQVGDKIIEKTQIILPNILVENEQEKMLTQFKYDVAAMGMPFENYIKKINKTEEDLCKEWKTDAEKRAKLQLILNKIAEEESIKAKEGDIEREVKHLLQHHKDANPENVRIYITTVLTNEKVFEFLEKTAD